MKQAVIEDFIKPEFIGKNPEDYEVQEDGSCVRKDRWEMAVRSIREKVLIGGRGSWEIKDVIAAVEDAVSMLTCAGGIYGCAGGKHCTSDHK